MPNLFAPKAPLPPLPADDEQPINYKATAVSYVVACLVMLAIDIQQQKRDRREAASARALDELYDLPAAAARPCLDAHCRDGRHVYREDIEDLTDAGGTEG